MVKWSDTTFQEWQPFTRRTKTEIYIPETYKIQTLYTTAENEATPGASCFLPAATRVVGPTCVFGVVNSHI